MRLYLPPACDCRYCNMAGRSARTRGRPARNIPVLFFAPTERPTAFVEPGILLHHLARAGEVVSRQQNRAEHRCGNQEPAQRCELGDKQREWKDLPTRSPALGQCLASQEGRTAEKYYRHREERTDLAAEQGGHG